MTSKSCVPFHHTLSLEILSKGNFSLCLDDLVRWLAGFIRQKVGIKLKDLVSDDLVLAPVSSHTLRALSRAVLATMAAV